MPEGKGFDAMISRKDALIISHLRKDGRIKVTKIAKSTGIPVTTIYDRIQRPARNVIKRHVTLLDFEKLGLHAHSNVAIKVDRSHLHELESYLLGHPNVNSLSRINHDFDFLAETVFRNIAESEEFIGSLQEKFPISMLQKFPVVNELKKEAFLTDPSHHEALREDAQ
ncbi:Lrp/AsnC family transcriptional regulator [Candidatus Woesearchaeota archaeon]|nr:Lrp/AsnC family transcriptional regulator [Candidatus Woesearchaeota archaeon]HIH38137.1 Lrp/AsnC family transcriptional regulator [Candidatus Woesearchaeota archaeon]HIH49586.1 Lrp/AsnC family transcriptional regulator [Candidatus Woesearchaeota archaeon]HIJ04396.1 Lrp/AsnC family transcriptional regulator [Candidatus Woesearchaeota archaeon]